MSFKCVAKKEKPPSRIVSTNLLLAATQDRCVAFLFFLFISSLAIALSFFHMNFSFFYGFKICFLSFFLRIFFSFMVKSFFCLILPVPAIKAALTLGTHSLVSAFAIVAVEGRNPPNDIFHPQIKTFKTTAGNKK
jgi:hypothetical protein